MWAAIKQTLDEFQKDECPRLAAALAFYTVFSLPALVIATVTIAGLFWPSREEAQERFKEHISNTVSPEVAEHITKMLDEPRKPSSRMTWIAGLAVLLIGASGALVEVQTALNRAWGVKPDPKQSWWHTYVWKRVFSLTILLAIAFLLLASLVVSWMLAEFGKLIDANAPGWLSSQMMGALNLLVSFIIITLLFATILKFLPDVKLAWRDVWAGAILTSLLFALGKTGLSIYLAWSNPASAYGAAGSVILILIWIYYSAMILFLGAEFTQVISARRGKRVQPEEGAVHAEFVGAEPKTKHAAAT